MLYVWVLIGFLQVFSFSEADGTKGGVLARRAQAVSVLLSPDTKPEEKREASSFLEKMMNRMENPRDENRQKSAALKRSDGSRMRDDTDDYVNYPLPSDELLINVFDYDGLLNGTSWLVFDESNLEPAPALNKFEILKRLLFGQRYK